VQAALLVIFGLIYGAALVAINWVIWFILLPMVFRQLRDQLRQLRDRKKSTWDTTETRHRLTP